jgi:hypothetical protein
VKSRESWTTETLNRFRQLEGPRSDAPDAPAHTPTSDRFDVVLAPGEKPPAGRPSSAFRPPAEGHSSIAVDAEGFKAVPRNDCPRCERPNNLFDRKCVNCGARLDTPAARSHNEKLWRASQPESEQEGPAPELPIPGAEPLSPPQEAARRTALEELAAREMGRRPRRAGEQIALWRFIMGRNVAPLDEESAGYPSGGNLPVLAAVVLALFLLGSLMVYGPRLWHLPVVVGVGLLLLRRRI